MRLAAGRIASFCGLMDCDPFEDGTAKAEGVGRHGGITGVLVAAPPGRPDRNSRSLMASSGKSCRPPRVATSAPSRQDAIAGSFQRRTSAAEIGGNAASRVLISAAEAMSFADNGRVGMNMGAMARGNRRDTGREDSGAFPC